MHKKKRKASLEIRCRLANNVKELRNKRGYTQEGLAKLCLLSEKYISNIEQASVNVTLASLEALAKGLGCTEADLLRRPASAPS